MRRDVRSFALVALGGALAASLSAQKGLRTYRGKEAIVKSNTSAALAKVVLERVENYCGIYGDFYDGLGLKAKHDNTIAVRVFETQSEFEASWQRLHPGEDAPMAYFSPSWNSLVLYNDGGNVTLRSTLLHECSHQYLGRYTFDAPSWLNEGLAEYFEGWRVTAQGELVERRPLLYDLLLVQGALTGHGASLAPRTLVEMSAETFADFPGEHRRMHRYMHYATAWSLVYYSLEGGHGEDRARLVGYLRALQKDGPNARFEVDDWSGFEARWRDFVLGMKPELKDAEDHFLVADGHFQNEDYEKAAEHFAQAFELAPEYPGIAFELGRCAYRTGDWKTARGYFQTASAERPDDTGPLMFLARTTLPEDPEAALEIAQRAAKMTKGSDPWILDLVATCQAAGGDTRAALRTLKKAAKLVDDESETYFEDRIEEMRNAGK